jgi:hypothetical protein
MGRSTSAPPPKAIKPADLSSDHLETERHRKISQAAYLRAQRRGFEGGDPMQDWLEAESEVNASWPPTAASHE